MEALPAKNTFIHFDEPASPAAPPTKTAPGTLLDKSFRMLSEASSPSDEASTSPAASERQEEDEEEPQQQVTASVPAAPSRRGFFRRLFGASGSEALPPVSIEAKNTFVHFAEPRTPSGPPSKTAPERTVFLAPSGPAVPAVPASIGAEGHCTGECIPCLMQLRWQAGRCDAPCRFGVQCGRCHEPHTEEELQKVQARMRKEKRRRGRQAVAQLSAAYTKGNVVPVGAGASMLKQSL